MHRFHTWYFYLFASLFSLSSCEDVVDLPLDSRSELVVFSNFSDQNGLEVFVYKTKSVTNSQPTEYIKDADVRVFKGGDLLEVLSLVSSPDNGNRPPHYKTTALTPEFDVEYTIEVKVEGFETITAKNSIPTPVNLEGATFDPSVSTGSNAHTVVDFDVSVSLKDPISIANYYHLKFYQELTSFTITAEGDTIWGNTYLEFPSDVESINFDDSLVKYQNEQSYLIEDSQFDGQYITLEFTGQYSFDPSKSIPGRFLIELRTVSEAYYLYYESLNRQNQNNNHLGEGVVVYNNIDNGLGNFAGFTSKVNSFKLTD